MAGLVKEKKVKPKKVPKAKKLLTKLKKNKDKIVSLGSVKNKERKVMNKNIKRYKMNLLRNRPVPYILKNLNSDVRLSFYDKKLLKDFV
jgi:hypothetical protein